MSKCPEFSFVIASSDDHENPVCEIYCGEKFCGLISRDDGSFKLEMPGVGMDESRILRRVDLHVFQTAVGEACRKLSGV